MPEDPTTLELPEDASARIEAAVRACQADIALAAKACGRDPADVSLLAVTKYVPGAVIRLLYDTGLRHFGESRVQRAHAVSHELADLDDVEWHLIGHLQRNKVRRAVECCRVIHSIDSLRLAEELTTRLTASRESAETRRPVDVYVEINVAGESAKTGLPAETAPGVLEHLTAAAATDPQLRIAGLMTMAPFHPDPEDARPVFRRLRELRDSWVESGRLPADAGLSMGMSHDFTVAIEEGATVLRIGRRLVQDVLAHSETSPG